MKVFFFLLGVLIAVVKAFHPLALSFLVLALSGISAILFYSFSYKWLFCALMLVYLGGIMILFIYVAALSMEDKVIFRLSSQLSGVLVLMFLVVFFTGFSLSPCYFSYSSALQMVSTLYSVTNSSLLILLLVYLLISLFSVVKISESFKGTLMKTHGTLICN